MSVSLIDQSTQNWSFRNRVVIFHFFWRLLFISNACVLEGVLNTGSDVSICCVSLPRDSFSRKMSLQLIFSLCASRLDDKDTASEGSRKRDKRPEMWETNFIACLYVASGFYQFFFSLQLIFSLCASRLDDKNTASEGSRKRDKRPEMWGTNSILCVYVAGGILVRFSVLVRPRARANEETMGEGERGREKDRYTRLACVAGEKGEVEEGERKREGGEKGRVSYPLSPIPLPFSLSRYPQPLSTPATQAKRPPAFSPLRLLKRWRFFSLGTSATTTAATTSP